MRRPEATWLASGRGFLGPTIVTNDNRAADFAALSLVAPGGPGNSGALGAT